MKKKRILILNWRSPKDSQIGGAEKVTLKYAQAWRQKGWQVEWIAGKKAYFLAPFIYWLKHKGNFNLVIDQIHGLPFLTPFWALKSKKLAFIHEVAAEIWDEMYPFPLNLLGRLVEKISLLFYKNVAFWTASISTVQDLENHGIPKKNITIIPHGTDLSFLKKPTPKAKKSTFLFVGRLVKMKKIEEIIKTFAQIQALKPNSQLWIAGRGNKTYIKYLKKLVKKLNLDKSVKFWGFVPEKKKILLYQKAHFLIHTSLKEGFGLVVLEANSQGTPAIVYNSPGLKNVVKNGINGFKVEKDNFQALALKIINTYENKLLYEKLCLSSIKYAQKFTWDKAVGQSIELIEKLLSK